MQSVIKPKPEPKSMHSGSDEVALWHRNEDGRQNRTTKETTENSLQEDRILDLTKSRLLNPSLTVKDLSDNIAVLVLGNPGLSFVAVVCVEGVHRSFSGAFRFDGSILGVLKQLPGTEMTVVETVKNDAHALPGSDECGDTDDIEKDREHTPCTACVGQCDEKIDKDAESNDTDTKTTSKDNTRTVAVADGPTDEVRVSLTSERPLDCGEDVFESGRVGGILQGVEESCTFSTREVEFARTAFGNVDTNDTLNLISEWLNGDYEKMSVCIAAITGRHQLTWLPLQTSFTKGITSSLLGFLGTRGVHGHPSRRLVILYAAE